MEYSEKEAKAVVWACYISGFIAPLLSTMMNLSLVNIGEDFNIGSHDLAYVNSAFLLASVLFMVPFAKLADIIGKKKMFVIGLMIIVIGCFIACLAPGFWFVVLGRAIIGVGAASIATVSISMITDVTPPQRRGTALGYNTMFIYMGLSLGPFIGGTLNDLIGWRLLFLLTVPLAAISTFIILKGFKGDIRPDPDGVFDTKGSIIYGIAILLSMGGVMNLPATWAIVSLVVGLLFFILFIKNQIGNSHCLLKMSLFKNWVFTGSCIAAFMSYAASYSISFFLALYLQSIGSLTATEAGVVMVTQPLVQCLTTAYFGKLTDRMENKAILPTVGMILTAVCLFTYTTYDIDTPLYMPIVSMIIGGLGFAMFSSPNTTIIMSSVPREHTSEASGMVSFMRQSGMVVSMGIAMLIITVTMGSTDNLGPETYGLFLNAMTLSMTVCLVMCIVGAITSVFRGIPKKI
jgi:MFS family permease